MKFNIYKAKNGNIKGFKEGWSWLGFIFGWLGFFAVYFSSYLFTDVIQPIPGSSKLEQQERLKNISLSSLIKTMLRLLLILALFLITFGSITALSFYLLIESDIGRIFSIIYLIGLPIFLGLKLNNYIEVFLLKKNCQKIGTVEANTSKSATIQFIENNK